MARVANVEIPNQKRGEIALTYIFGIGRPTARRVLSEVAVNPDKKVLAWTEQEFKKIREFIATHCMVEGELRGEIRKKIERQKQMGSRRGNRLRNGLPVRGQNTKNNASTAGGRRKKRSAGQKK